MSNERQPCCLAAVDPTLVIELSNLLLHLSDTLVDEGDLPLEVGVIVDELLTVGVVVDLLLVTGGLLLLHLVFVILSLLYLLGLQIIDISQSCKHINIKVNIIKRSPNQLPFIILLAESLMQWKALSSIENAFKRSISLGPEWASSN